MVRSVNVRLNNKVVHLKAHAWVASATLLIVIVYLKTLAPTVIGMDSAELTLGAYTLGIVHAPGYSVYLLLGHLFTYFPLGDVGYRLNLFSALAGTGSALWVILQVERLTLHRFAAVTAGLSYAFCFYHWSMSVIAEVYTLQAMLLSVILGALWQWQAVGTQRWLAGAVLVSGLAFANTPASVLWWPGLFWLFWRTPLRIQLHLADYGRLALILVCAIMALIYLPLRSAAHPQFVQVGYFDEWATFHALDLTQWTNGLWYISGQQFASFIFGYTTWAAYGREGLHFLHWLLIGFGGVGLPLGIWGFGHLWHKARNWAVGLALIMLFHTVFFVGYRAVDKETMFLPVFLLWAVCMGVGMVELCKSIPHPGQWVLGLLPLGLLLINYSYCDVSDFDYPLTIAAFRLKEAAQDAIFLATWGDAEAMQYHQITQNLRPDVRVINIFFTNPKTLDKLVAHQLDLGKAIYSTHATAVLSGSYRFRPLLYRYQLMPKALPITPEPVCSTTEIRCR